MSIKSVGRGNNEPYIPKSNNAGKVSAEIQKNISSAYPDIKGIVRTLHLPLIDPVVIGGLRDEKIDFNPGTAPVNKNPPVKAA